MSVDWYPEPESRGGPLRRLYNALRTGTWIPAVWVGLCVTLAGSLVVTAVVSARSADALDRQIEQLEEQIQRAKDGNAPLSPDGRQ